MSAALVRQALDFVDPDESNGNKKKRGGRSRGAAGQASVEINNPESDNKRKSKRKADSKEAEVISKLLKLSKPTVDKKITQKIVERAVTGKPIFDKIEVKEEVQKSILFPEDDEPSKDKKKNKKHKKRY